MPDFKAVFAHAPNPILVIDRSNNIIVAANDRSGDLCNLPRGAILGSTISEMLQNSENIEELLLGTNAADAIVPLSLKVRRKERKFLAFRSEFSIDGKPYAQIHLLPAEYAQDVTAWKGAAQKQNSATTIDTDKVRNIQVVYSGFVLATALGDLLNRDRLEASFIAYPEEYDPDDTALKTADFCVFALPNVGEVELDDLKQLARRNKHLNILVMCLRASNRTVISLIKSGIRGVISNEDEFALLPTAINAIVNDELWCPRSILQQVFENYQLNGHAGDAVRNKSSLSDREEEILALLVRGLKNREIGEELNISYSTVINHTYNIYRKLGVNNRAGAIRLALSENLI